MLDADIVVIIINSTDRHTYFMLIIVLKSEVIFLLYYQSINPLLPFSTCMCFSWYTFQKPQTSPFKSILSLNFNFINANILKESPYFFFQIPRSTLVWSCLSLLAVRLYVQLKKYNITIFLKSNGSVNRDN